MLCGGLFFRYASQKNKALLMIFSVWTCFNSSLTVRLKRFFWSFFGQRLSCSKVIMFKFQFHPVSSKLLQIERHGPYGQSESVKTRWVAPQCQVQNTRNLPAGSSPLQLSTAWKAAIHPSHIPHPKSRAVLVQMDRLTTASLAESEGTLHQLKMSPAGRIHFLYHEQAKEQTFDWCQGLWGFQHASACFN